jgi:hypothetical protein
MTNKELREWKFNYVDEILPKNVIVDGVSLTRTGTRCIAFRYGNARGLVFPDNGYNGGDSYYPLVRVRPSFCDESRYTPTCQPNAQAIAATVKSVWQKFIS